MQSFNINQTIRFLQRVLLGHIGSGDKAHLPATEHLAGFMSDSHVRALEMAKGRRVYLPEVDPFDQEPGFYEGARLLNVPDSNAVYQYDVSIGLDGRKQVLLIESFSGRILFKNIHNNVLPAQWSVIKKEDIVLWSGSESAVGTVITCSIDPRQFNSIRIEIDLENTGTASATHSNIVSRVFSVQGLNLMDNATDTQVEFYELAVTLQSGQKSFSIARNKKVRVVGNATNTIVSGGASITKIVGIV